ncbi:Deoxynucleoside kinase [Macleaya cordata]|uniref:Deoxynucleoside kinase n=1 Tax=Macleaya cordata TaxID=56857 RepID=A0A200QR38_MACCD|nr:Deoxynucleoside kinase [Macleaya cordata]
MQKLFRRSPSGPIICTAVPSPPWGINFNKQKKKKNFNFPPVFNLPSPPSPTMSATTFVGGLTATTTTTDTVSLSKKLASARFVSSNCGICRCLLDNGVSPLRAWVVLKEGQSAVSRSAWLHTKTSDGFQVVSAKESSSSSSSPTSSDCEEKPLRLHRRQRGSSLGGGGPTNLPGSPDLLTIPGVGPRNLRKLVDKGTQEFFGKSSQTMVEYLQSSVGIIHRNHAESITSFIKESVDEEIKEESPNSDAKPSKNKRLTFCVEGNISVGKTTFLQRIANETLELRDLVEVVPEPISKWQDVGPDHFNILDAFYAEPQRYAYTFQNYVFVTRVMQERESSGGVKPLRLMERSVFSDRMVFVRAVHEANWMNEMEISIYDSWFDPVVSTLPGLIPDGFIYLRASPDTCHKRMMLRKRTEEGGVSLDYLRGLHEKHESWLFPFQSGNHGVLSVSQLPLHLDSSLHPDIRDRVFYLEGDHMHSSIQKVPALVLDCEPNIDFSKDIDAKRQYARQVAEFFEFVKKKKEIPSPKAGDNGNKSSQPVLMPRKGLWVPDGKHFPESALSSLDFRRAMSFLSG